MDISLPSVFLGVGAILVLRFAYLAATKGVPAAYAWVKAKVSAAEGAVSKIKADLEALETGAVAGVQKDVAALKADVAAIKTKVGV